MWMLRHIVNILACASLNCLGIGWSNCFHARMVRMHLILQGQMWVPLLWTSCIIALGCCHGG